MRDIKKELFLKFLDYQGPDATTKILGVAIDSVAESVNKLPIETLMGRNKHMVS